MTRIRIDRPEVPDGYGVQKEGPYLEWSEIEERLAEARHYWVSTARPDGRPHSIPRWGVWLDTRFWYDGSSRTRHARNLGQEGPCLLHLESGQSVTIVEGVSAASEPVSLDLGSLLSSEFARKYDALGYAPAPDAWSDEDAGGLRVLTPSKVIAWSRFPTDPTRFRFDSDSP